VIIRTFNRLCAHKSRSSQVPNPSDPICDRSYDSPVICLQRMIWNRNVSSVGWLMDVHGGWFDDHNDGKYMLNDITSVPRMDYVIVGEVSPSPSHSVQPRSTLARCYRWVAIFSVCILVAFVSPPTNMGTREYQVYNPNDIPKSLETDYQLPGCPGFLWTWWPPKATRRCEYESKILQSAVNYDSLVWLVTWLSPNHALVLCEV
jgi:hypothetical protein